MDQQSLEQEKITLKAVDRTLETYASPERNENASKESPGGDRHGITSGSGSANTEQSPGGDRHGLSSDSSFYSPPAVPWWRGHLRLLVIAGFLAIAAPISIFFGALTGDDYLDKGQIDKAMLAYQMHLSRNPGDKHALERVGQIFLQEREYDKAIGYFTAYLSIDPTDDSIRHLRSAAYRLNNQPGLALEDLHKLKQDHKCWIDLLEVNAALGKTAEVNDLLAKILTSSNYANQPLQQFELLIAAKHFDQALALANKHILQGDTSVQDQWRLNRAFVYKQLGQYQKALADYDKFVKPNIPGVPSNVRWGYVRSNLQSYGQELPLNYAESLAMAGRSNDAIELYKAIISDCRSRQFDVAGSMHLNYLERQQMIQAMSGLHDIYLRIGDKAGLSATLKDLKNVPQLDMNGIYSYNIDQVPNDRDVGQNYLPEPVFGPQPASAANE